MSRRRVMAKRMAAAVLALATSAPALAETIAITGGRVVPGDGRPPVEGATVLIVDGRVTAMGTGIAIPASARRIDAAGRWVTPGIFAGFSRVGLVEVDAVRQTNDLSAGGSPFTASLDIAPAINPAASAIAVSRAAGVTRAAVVPVTGRSIFAGQGALIDLGADSNAVTRARAFQFVELGEEGAAKAGGSRVAAHTMLRNALVEARAFARRQGAAAGADPRLAAAAGTPPRDDMLNRFDVAALVPVVTGRQRLLVHVERASDIRAALALRTEFPDLRLVLAGASEGWLVADEIAAAGVPVIASALRDLPDAFERLAATQSNIGRMRRAGVEVAIGMIDDREAHQIRYSPQYAGNLVALQRVPGAAGLSWDEAFASISGVPARILGEGGRLGVLAPGAAGDAVIWDGDPLELSSAPVAVFVDGAEQPLSNRQERLRDRYRTAGEGALPKAYSP